MEFELVEMPRDAWQEDAGDCVFLWDSPQHDDEAIIPDDMADQAICIPEQEYG